MAQTAPRARSTPYLRIASSGVHVVALQEELRRVGLLESAADGTFGVDTEAAVRRFQERHELAPDGIVGPRTWAALAEGGLDVDGLPPPLVRTGPPPRIFLRTGSWGPHVGAVQEQLGLPPTTLFDAETAAAVREFQAGRRLAQDGIVGLDTWSELVKDGLRPLDLPPFGGGDPIAVSPSIRSAHDRVAAREVTAYEITAALLASHPSYAGGRARTFAVGPAPPDCEALFFTEWLARVRPLFDRRRQPELHTRTVVWGLALLDPELERRLDQDDFLTAFRASHDESLLSPAGLRLWRHRLRPGTAITSDTWSAEDHLQYELYAYAIADFILDERTRAPLTIGIKAPWGAGKTSLMRMIRRRLDPEADAPPAGDADRHLRVRELLRDIRGQSPEQASAALVDTSAFNHGTRSTVWFNAWKYQSSEQLWAGLAHAIVSQVEARMSPLQRERFWASLHVKRLHPSAVRRGLHRALATRVIPWAVVAAAGALVAATSAVVPGLGMAAAAAVGAAARWAGFLREDVAATAPTLVRDPGYDGKLGFLHLVDEDMKRILAVAGATRETPLVVFIDDLDRCSYTTVAQVIEALNVFLAGDFDNCIFVIAMEPDLVAAQIHVAYEKLFQQLDQDQAGDLGWRFLEKMVQLPIALPPPDATSVGRYVRSIAGAKLERVAADLADDAPEVVTAKALLREEHVTSAVQVRPALNRVRERAAATPQGLTDRQEAALRKVGREEFARRLDEDDPGVVALLTDLARELPPNPREIKRFINVFRFYAYIQYVREDAGLEAPSIEGVAKLALLAVRYPHLLSVLGAEVAQDGRRRPLLAWLEEATDDTMWSVRLKFAPTRLHGELTGALQLRALVTRQPAVGVLAAGFL